MICAHTHAYFENIFSLAIEKLREIANVGFQLVSCALMGMKLGPRILSDGVRFATRLAVPEVANLLLE